MSKRWPLYLLTALLLIVVIGALYGVLRSNRKPFLPEDESEVQRIPCTLIQTSLIPDTESPFPPTNAQDWRWGPDDAPVTIVEYGDFQCPHCGMLAPEIIQLRDEFPEDLQLVFRHFPLESLHDKAYLAAQAAQAAGAQGEFWSMHDLLFLRQEEWTTLSQAEFQTWLVMQAQTLGLNVDQFTRDLVSEKTVNVIKQAYDTAIEIGLDGTPTLAINGQYYEGIKDRWTLGSYIKLIKLESHQFNVCPPQEIVPRKNYVATLHTTKGDLILELYARQAPLAVNNFVYLARQGWYDNVDFHRVIPGYVTQTGDPSGTGLGGPGYTFEDEISTDTLFDDAGLVAMANFGPNTNGSQFFITYTPQESLDGKYTIFGKVTAGMDVVRNLAKRDPAMDTLALPPADKILSVTIDEE